MRSFLFFLFLFSMSVLIAQQQVQPSLDLVNTSYDEQNPVVSPDGKLLFFTICNHPQNIGGKKDPGDIWFSALLNGQWTAPVHAGTLLNDRGYNAVAGFSFDGNQVFLLSHYDGTGNAARTQGISVSRKNANGWHKPENISIPYFQNKSTYHSGHVSADGKVFVYSAETYGSRVEDLYVSVKEPDGKWTEPKNLGDKINTQFQELSPSISADGKTLYFSTNGRRGNGSFDIYTATRLGEGWTTWSDPVNVGDHLNSDGRDLFFRDYPTLGFSIYTSKKNSDNYGDIRINTPVSTDSVPPAIAAPPADTLVQIEVITRTEFDSLIRVYGRITDTKTGEPITATLFFENSDSQIKTQTIAGNYTLKILSTASYDIKIDAPGFVSSLEKLDVNTYEMKELEMNFKLQPIEIGTTVTLKNVLFMQSKPELLPASYPELDLVVQFMKENPHLEIELAGHTDNRGSFRQLMTLSQQRVNKVKSYLVSKGISAKRIVGKGYGGSKPIASNDTEETRMLNRRVEFIIKKL